jgi:hypothetical protein
MRTGRLLGVGLVVALLLLPLTAFSQQQATTNYRTIVIETFDDPEESRWEVVGSKFVNSEYPQVAWVETWPDALYRVKPEGVTLRSLGVQAAFDRMGYNYVEFIPVEDVDGETVPRGIPIPGRIRYLDMWVWGSNYDYYVDIHLRDYRGMIHVLKLGNINYRGWRDLRIQIPTWIPQGVVYVPQFQGLELVKIVLWTRPDEKVDGFYVYLDEIKIETDVFEDPFDGELLGRPEQVQQLWDAGVTVE